LSSKLGISVSHKPRQSLTAVQDNRGGFGVSSTRIVLQLGVRL